MANRTADTLNFILLNFMFIYCKCFCVSFLCLIFHSLSMHDHSNRFDLIFNVHSLGYLINRYLHFNAGETGNGIQIEIRIWIWNCDWPLGIGNCVKLTR